jgi:hypothetical protein
MSTSAENINKLIALLSKLTTKRLEFEEKIRKLIIEKLMRRTILNSYRSRTAFPLIPQSLIEINEIDDSAMQRHYCEISEIDQAIDDIKKHIGLIENVSSAPFEDLAKLWECLQPECHPNESTPGELTPNLSPQPG